MTQALDSLNRATEVRSNGFNGETAITEQTYNGRGQMIEDTVIRYIGEARFANEYEYDVLSRMVSKIDATQTDNPFSQFEFLYTHYVHNGLTSTILVGSSPTAPNCVMQEATLTITNQQLCVERTFATNGWLLSTMDAHGSEMGYWYDGQGNPVVIEDAHDPSDSGNLTIATYNNVGHRTALNDPNMGAWSYTYNGLGEVVAQTDANNTSFSFSYDNLGRTTQRVANNACVGVPGALQNNITDNWNYDGPVTQGTQGLLLSGNRNDCDVLISREYRYDEFTRPEQTLQWSSPGFVYSHSWVI